MKKSFIVIFLILTVLFTGCGTKQIDSTTSEEKEKERFDITFAELIAKLDVLYSIDLELITVVDSDDGSEIATYRFIDEGDEISEMIHYSLHYDADSNKLYSISFFFDKNYKGDLEKALTRYCYHIAAIAKTIENDINVEEFATEIIDAAIKWESKEDEFASTLITRNNFTLHAHCSDKFYNALFMPN